MFHGKQRGNNMSKFEYDLAKINNYIKDNNIEKVPMLGVYADLKKLKPIIEKLYDEHIFYLSYWETDAPYHGWDLHSEQCRNMEKITDAITEKIEEIYSLILGGLGEQVGIGTKEE